MYTGMSVTTASVADFPCLPWPTAPATDPFASSCLFVSSALPAAGCDAAVAPVRLDIAEHFANVPDPRHRAFRDHHLLDDILVLALTAVLCGAKSWEAIADFGTTKEAWFRSLGLKLPNGIPSHDTFNRVFAAMKPRAFRDAFTSWINSVCGALGFCHIPIDGKAVRGSRGPEGTCLHLVSAWVCEQRMTLAQIAVADKSNEITAIPMLLKMLDVTAALVSIDAIGCQKDIAREIRVGEADYLLAVKDNQPTLYADVQACFARAQASNFAGLEHEVLTTNEVKHGRQEERVYTVIYEPTGLSTQHDWQDLKTVVQVDRTVRQADKQSKEVAHYISSSTAKAQVLAEGVRRHWSIENSQHWVLDAIFAEDRCRSRHGNAAENLAWLRKMALAVFGQDQSKGSIPTRQFRAAADDEYRFHLLNILSVEYA
jgi:predicted transposase YbfD/YdcC